MWSEFWAVFTDPAHAMAEIAWSAIWDVIFITVIYQLLIKRVLYPRWSRRLHQEIDTEHGVDHDFAVEAQQFDPIASAHEHDHRRTPSDAERRASNRRGAEGSALRPQGQDR